MDVDSATFVLGATSLNGMPADGLPEAAFLGRSNVGKSSFLNTLLRRRSLARTSREPGKTREANFYLINKVLYFVDLPGLGYARTSKRERASWERLIESYLTRRSGLRLVFQLIDGRHAPTALDRDAALLIRESPAHHVVVVTKADKLSGNERSVSARRVEDMLLSLGLEVPVVVTSAKTGRGRDEVLKWVDTLVV
jgi:GTP-binding protein